MIVDVHTRVPRTPPTGRRRARTHKRTLTADLETSAFRAKRILTKGKMRESYKIHCVKKIRIFFGFYIFACWKFFDYCLNIFIGKRQIRNVDIFEATNLDNILVSNLSERLYF